MRYQQLIENKSIVYHGDSIGTTALQAKWMMHDTSNNQEGVGIYFTPDINVATNYGPKVSAIDLSGLTIENSRSPVENIIDDENAIALITYLSQNNDDFWYIYSDYGIEVAEPEDVEEYHSEELYQHMRTQMARDWQLELTQASDVITFVTAWNKFIPIDGIFERETMFYAIINTDIVATPVNNRNPNET
jgi:hypothetical protein